MVTENVCSWLTIDTAESQAALLTLMKFVNYSGLIWFLKGWFGLKGKVWFGVVSKGKVWFGLVSKVRFCLV